MSDLDGAIGDGDHGINMNKGFTLCEKVLKDKPGNLAYSLETLSDVLITEIGGSMGPLYGLMFSAMSDLCAEEDYIYKNLFGKMLSAAECAVRDMGNADVGDKTLLDVLVPSTKAFNEAIEAGVSFMNALSKVKDAAIMGRNSTKDMIAKVGRASRLGERSKGFIDAGAASCCLIIITLADSVADLIAD